MNAGRVLRHWPWLVCLTLVGAIAAVGLSQLERTLGSPHPAGDHAIFELNVRRALSGDQRVGPYSQGFYHPGPAYFYMLAPAYALCSHSTFALHAGALLLTLFFVLSTCAVVARYGSSFSATLALLPLLLIELGYLGDYPQFDYWPPYVLFFGFALFLFLAAGLFAGTATALAPLMVLGSFLVQTHVSYAPCVVVVSALALAHAALTRPGFLRGRARLNVVLALLLFALMWALPLRTELDQPSNFARLYRTFFQAPAGATSAAIVDRLALEYSAQWQFVLFRDRFIFPDAPKHYIAARWMGLIQLALVALAWRSAWAKGDHFTAGLCAVCVASLVVAAYSLIKIRGTVAPHHTAWISIIGLGSWVAIFAGTLTIETPRWAAAPLTRFSLLLGGWLVSSLVWPIRTISAVHANPEIGVLSDSIAKVISKTEPGRVKISWSPASPRGEGPPEAQIWAVAVMLELEKSNLRFFTGPNPHLRWMLGERRWEAAVEPSSELVFSVGRPAPPLEPVLCIERGENYFLRYPVCVGKANSPVPMTHE